jgi:1-hydroxy-2-isopentenylcarotenoid 3,4-desaturase
MTRAVVIGGGLVGLSTAALLSRGGLEVTLLERHPNTGGRSAPIRAKGALLDAAPGPFSYQAMSDFHALLGRNLHDHLDLVEPDIRLRVFIENETGLPSETFDLEHDAGPNWDRLDELAPDEGRAVSRLVLRTVEREPLIRQRLHNVPLTRSVPALSLSVIRRLRWLYKVLGTSVGKELSTSLGNPDVRSLLECSILGLTGSPSSTPVAYSSVYTRLLTGVVRYPRGGVASVVSTLEDAAREEGSEIRTEFDVARILVDPETRLATGVISRSGDVLPADVVVSCVDPHHTDTSLVPPEYRSFPESQWARRPAPSAIVALLVFKKRVRQLAHHNVFLPQDWDRVISDLEGERVADPLAFESVYVGRPTATDSKAAPRGKDLLSLVIPLPADPSLGADDRSSQDLRQMITRVVSQIGFMADIPDLGERLHADHVSTPADFASDYSAWQGSLMGIAPTIKNLLLPRPTITSPKVGNLVHAGMSLLPGWGMEGALDAAAVTAKALLGSEGTESLPVPAPQGFLRLSTRTDVLGDLLRDAPGDGSTDDA